jgi:hypothetical protein
MLESFVIDPFEDAWPATRMSALCPRRATADGRFLPVSDRRQHQSRPYESESICGNEALWTSLTRVGFFHLTRQR